MAGHMGANKKVTKQNLKVIDIDEKQIAYRKWVSTRKEKFSCLY